MADREYRRVWSGLMDHPTYQALSPRGRLVLFGALFTLQAPFPSALDTARLAEGSLIDVSAVDRVLSRLVAAGLLVRHGDLFSPGALDGHALVIVPTQYYVRPRRVRRRIPRRVRELVALRDGYRCKGCGRTRLLELDHVVPWSLGGSDEPENLQLLCGPCNRRKGPTAFITHRMHREARA